MLTQKNNIFKSSIAKNLIFYVILFSSLITLVITSAQIYHEYTVELNNIDNNFNQIKDVHLESITHDVWAVDTLHAKTLLEGILRMPDMEYLEISENNKIWMSVGEKQSTNVIEKSYPMIFNSRGQKRTIGKLKTIVALDPLYNRLTDKVITILISNSIKTFLVAGLMLILFYKLVTRHIIKIVDHLDNHNIGNEFPEPLALDRSKPDSKDKDELAILVDRLNEMQQNVTQSYNQLKESEEKHRQLVELAQEGIWTIDKDGQTIFANPSMASILGYSVEEMLGKHLFEFMDDRGKEIAKQNMDRRSSGISETHDFEFLKKTGERIYATMATAPIYNSEGEYTGAIAGVLDITERKEAEHELLNYKQHLEDLISERTNALEVSNKELEAFSYSVAHDLRTPLRSITSFSQILHMEETENLSQDGKDALSRIITAGKNMSQLIDELLELSRISRTEMKLSNVDLSHLANDIINQLNNNFPGQQSKISIAEKLEVTADKTLMHILLQNLIQNAWKFTNNEKIREIEIGKTEIDLCPYFYIKDNGIGFSMEYQHKLFEPFQRLHEPYFSGNGIGLATVKRIINRHGGKIWANAEENMGATFYFSIPGKTQILDDSLKTRANH